MKYGSIDIGTNAALLLVMSDENGVQEVLDKSTITRLGQGLLRHRRLSTEAMERTLEALENYRTILDSLGALVVNCFGTSALREAENRDEFLRMARARAGVDVKIFSEYEEAYYTYLSVKCDPLIPGEDLVIVDIGGGSTEVTRGDRERFLDYVSLPVGTVKLTERFIKHDPPSREELDGLVRFLRDEVRVDDMPGHPIIVGMAGTMTTLAAIILGLKGFDKKKIHGLAISASTLHEWIERLNGMTIAERAVLPGMEPGREDLLLQGMILMGHLLASLHAVEFTVSTYGARYGVIYEALEVL